MDEIKNITSFLGGGWLSVAIGVILIGLIVWWYFAKHKILVDAATKKTLEERDSTEVKEKDKTSQQDATDKTGRDEVDSFLGTTSPTETIAPVEPPPNENSSDR